MTPSADGCGVELYQLIQSLFRIDLGTGVAHLVALDRGIWCAEY